MVWFTTRGFVLRQVVIVSFNFLLTTYLSFHYIQRIKMPTLPPNDPNHNQNNAMAAKEAPHDGRRQPRNEEILDVFGDLRDAPAVAVMFLIGMVAWFLRERCIC